MIKCGGPVRGLLWLVTLSVIGAAVGLCASRILWGYWLTPPKIKIESTARPTAVAFFQVWPSLVVRPIENRNEVLRYQTARCARGYLGECTLGRALFQTSNVAWASLPVLVESDVHVAYESAQRLSREAFLKAGQDGAGLVARYTSGGEVLTLVTFDTAEIRDDTHGHAEVLLRGSGSAASLGDVATYRFDVAGIEFATPKVLAILGVILTYATAGGALILRKLLARSGRPPGAGEQCVGPP